MKRLDRKQIKPSVFREGFIYRVSMLHLKNVFCYFNCDASKFSKLLLEKVDSITLPLIDVYEIKANTFEGLLVGYAFDCSGKNVKYSYNFITSTNIEFTEYKIAQLDPKSFGLKYKLGRVMLHSYEGMGSMVTTGLSNSAKETLDI